MNILGCGQGKWKLQTELRFILDYPDKPDVITRLLKVGERNGRENRKESSMRRMWPAHAWGRRKGHEYLWIFPESRQPLEGGKSGKINSLLKPLESNELSKLSFSPVRHMLDFRSIELYGNKFVLFWVTKSVISCHSSSATA